MKTKPFGCQNKVGLFGSSGSVISGSFPARKGFVGLDDLPGALAQIGDKAPVILLAHEPDIFPSVPDRVALTICGHTHGGQIALPLLGPLYVPSRYGTRYAYGHVRENGRDLIVSAGLGMSGSLSAWCTARNYLDSTGPFRRSRGHHQHPHIPARPLMFPFLPFRLELNEEETHKGLEESA